MVCRLFTCALLDVMFALSRATSLMAHVSPPHRLHVFVSSSLPLYSTALLFYFFFFLHFCIPFLPPLLSPFPTFSPLRFLAPSLLSRVFFCLYPFTPFPRLVFSISSFYSFFRLVPRSRLASFSLSPTPRGPLRSGLVSTSIRFSFFSLR